MEGFPSSHFRTGFSTTQNFTRLHNHYFSPGFPGYAALLGPVWFIGFAAAMAAWLPQDLVSLPGCAYTELSVVPLYHQLILEVTHSFSPILAGCFFLLVLAISVFSPLLYLAPISPLLLLVAATLYFGVNYSTYRGFFWVQLFQQTWGMTQVCWKICLASV